MCYTLSYSFSRSKVVVVVIRTTNFYLHLLKSLLKESVRKGTTKRLLSMDESGQLVILCSLGITLGCKFPCVCNLNLQYSDFLGLAASKCFFACVQRDFHFVTKIFMILFVCLIFQ